MNSDFRVDVRFFGKRKTRRLYRKLGDTGIRCLFQLWAYVAAHHPKGVLPGWDSADIEDAAGWSGQKGAFTRTLLYQKWMHKRPSGHQGYIIHEWEEHQPWAFFAKERAEKARKAANAKHEKS